MLTLALVLVLGSATDARDGVQPTIVVQGALTAEVAAMFKEALAPHADAPSVLVVIDSAGGDLDAGFQIAEAIEGARARIDCLVDGTASSMAFYVLQSCDRRWMTTRSILLAHEPWADAPPGSALTPRVVRQLLEQLEESSRRMAAHCTKKLNISAKSYADRVQKGDWVLTPKDALEVGAVDRVLNVTVLVHPKQDVEAPAAVAASTGTTRISTCATDPCR
jgi:ATP-dependent protease ClpP protease subunit